MVSKKHRFHGYNKLTAVYRKGKTARGPLMSLKYLPNQRGGAYRLAVVVSRKVHKSAVIRNRIRRRVFEQCRLLAPRFVADYDMIITVYSEQIADMPARALQHMIEKQLENAGIIGATTAPQPRTSAGGVV